MNSGAPLTAYVPFCKFYSQISSIIDDSGSTTYSFATKCCGCLDGYTPYTTGAGPCNINSCVQIRRDNHTLSGCTATITAGQNTVCESCYPGSLMMQGDTTACHQAAQMLLGCLQLNANGGCATCAAQFVLVQAGLAAASCLRQYPYCIANDATTGSCLRCEAYYYLSAGGQCQQLPLGCLAVLQSGDTNYDPSSPACKQCAASFTLYAGSCYASCAQVDKIWNNITLAFQSVCTACTSGYYVAAGGTCSPCADSNCLACSATQCTQCAPDYYISGATQNACSAHSPGVPNCSVYSQTVNSFCQACAAGFYAQGGTCHAYSGATTINCLSFSATADACLQCSAQGISRYLSGGRCLSYSAAQCTVGSLTSDVCTSCGNTFYVATSGTSCQSGTINNCLIYASQTVCSYCATGFALSFDGTQCLANTRHCYRLRADNTNCYLCNDGKTSMDSSYVLISGETDVTKQCQLIPFCLRAIVNKNAQYQCLECLAMHPTTQQDIALLDVVPAVWANQCVLNALQPAYVEHCREYLAAATSKQFCLQCQDDYIAEGIALDSGSVPLSGGGLCLSRSVQGAQSYACRYYNYNYKLENPSCQQCLSASYFTGVGNKNSEIEIRNAFALRRQEVGDGR